MAACCTAASVLLAACGGGGGDLPEAGSAAGQKSHADLADFLYGHSTAQVRYWASWDQVPSQYAYLADRMGGLPTGEAGVTTGLFSISYANTNLPQLSLHIRRAGNTRLLAYNHGHGGVPSPGEAFASEFLSRALAGGYDLLITSMPLVGLNAIPANPVEPFYVRTRDHANPVPVAPMLLTEFWSQHALFEVIDDDDHYMHFFIDGAVIPGAIAAAPSAGRPVAARFQEVLPYTGPRYASVDFVGLSGGATSGLPACAVQAFDNCILIAGVMPDYLRVGYFDNFGDVEQQARSFYEQFGVPDLMAIAAVQARSLSFVYNRDDPCCFADPSASRFQADFPAYDIRVTDLAFHGYRPDDLLALLHEP